mmetsp:Transcript_56612/g.133301  ORF Transcript_56612/g.133301 Transcript_56612/m.133301 type:complete len:167 (-) Transcript_56612:50-550(-)
MGPDCCHHEVFTGDRVASSEERLVFMTTNHAEVLDPALVRPGRIDVMEFIGDASDHQILAMFNKFFPDATALFGSRFLAGVQSLGKPVSMAQLQGHFLKFKDRPEAATTQLSELIETPFTDHSLSRATEAIQPANKPRKGPRRRMTVDEIDRMPFNPQPGWDADIR